MKKLLAIATAAALAAGVVSMSSSARAADPVPHLVLDATVGSGNSAVQSGIALGSKLLYIYYSPGTGVELWTSDGTAGGTKLVKDIHPGAQSGDISSLVTFNGKAYFQANDGQHGGELWVTDGTAAGTQMVADLLPGALGSRSAEDELVIAGGKMYFPGYTVANDDQLYVSDGTAAGTHVIKTIGASDKGSDVQELKVWGDRVVFQATDGSGHEPWVTDGTPAGTTILKDVNPGPGSSNAYNFTVIGTKLVFLASKDATLKQSVWTSDLATTTEVVPVAFPSGDMVALGDKALFVNSGGGGTGGELWVTDGTAAGTKLIKDIDPAVNQSSFIEEMTLFKGRLFFRANDSSNNGELWATDGTAAGTVKVKEINPVAGAYPGHFLAIGNVLYFEAKTEGSGNELWQSDGTGAGTHMTADLRPGPDSSSAVPVAAVGDVLFLKADDGVHSEELWANGIPQQPVTSIPQQPVPVTLRASTTSAHAHRKYSESAAKKKHVKVTVEVQSSGAVPTGTVLLMKGTKLMGEGSLVGGAIKIRITKKLRKGVTSVVAYYQGDGTTKPSASSTIQIKVK